MSRRIKWIIFVVVMIAILGIVVYCVFWLSKSNVYLRSLYRKSETSSKTSIISKYPTKPQNLTEILKETESPIFELDKISLIEQDDIAITLIPEILITEEELPGNQDLDDYGNKLSPYIPPEVVPVPIHQNEVLAIEKEGERNE